LVCIQCVLIGGNTGCAFEDKGAGARKSPLVCDLILRNRRDSTRSQFLLRFPSNPPSALVSSRTPQLSLIGVWGGSKSDSDESIGRRAESGGCHSHPGLPPVTPPLMPYPSCSLALGDSKVQHLRIISVMLARLIRIPPCGKLYVAKPVFLSDFGLL